MKKLLCLWLCLLVCVTGALSTGLAAGAETQDEWEAVRAGADHHDELFYYDADGNILCPAEGVVCAYGPHQGPHPTFEPGDLVHDGEINAKDALQVLKISVGVLYNWGKDGKHWWEIESWRSGKLCCHTETQDVNHDGHCDAKDALLILQYAVGKIDSFPAQPAAPTAMLVIQVGGQTFYAAPADNEPARALVEQLSAGPLTLTLQDYGGFEKVGQLPFTLPTADESITTRPGDVILYQGDHITLYYAPNTWPLTRLAHIEGQTTQDLLAVLGEGDVQATFSVEWRE